MAAPSTTESPARAASAMPSMAASPWSFVLGDHMIDHPDVARGEQVLGLPAQACDWQALPLAFTDLQVLTPQRLSLREYCHLTVHWRADVAAPADASNAGVTLSRNLGLQALQRYRLDANTPKHWGAVFRVYCEAHDALRFALGQALAFTRAPAPGEVPDLHWRNWSDEESLLRAWLGACMAWNPWMAHGPVKPLHARQITVTPQETRAEAALYCHLGEQLQGWRGYAGQNLDGFDEFLRHADQGEVAELQVHVQQATRVRDQLHRASGRADYFDELLDVLRVRGVRVSLS